MYLLTEMSVVPSARICGRDGVHVSAPADPIRGEKNAAVAPTRDGERADGVDAHRDTRARRRGEEDIGPS